MFTQVHVPASSHRFIRPASVSFDGGTIGVTDGPPPDPPDVSAPLLVAAPLVTPEWVGAGSEPHAPLSTRTHVQRSAARAVRDVAFRFTLDESKPVTCPPFGKKQLTIDR